MYETMVESGFNSIAKTTVVHESIRWYRLFQKIAQNKFFFRKFWKSRRFLFLAEGTEEGLKSRFSLLPWRFTCMPSLCISSAQVKNDRNTLLTRYDKFDLCGHMLYLCYSFVFHTLCICQTRKSNALCAFIKIFTTIFQIILLQGVPARWVNFSHVGKRCLKRYSVTGP